MHFEEHHSQLLPFCEYVFLPGKSSVEVQPEILDIILLRKVYVLYMGWWAGFFLCGECDMDWLGFISFFHLHFNRFCT
jgi:hypothetical protein